MQKREFWTITIDAHGFLQIDPQYPSQAFVKVSVCIKKSFLPSFRRKWTAKFFARGSVYNPDAKGDIKYKRKVKKKTEIGMKFHKIGISRKILSGFFDALRKSNGVKLNLKRFFLTSNVGRASQIKGR